jgi:hypothetical protein
MTTIERTTKAESANATLDDAVAVEGVGQAARQAAETVAGVAGEATARIPEVAHSTRMAITEANRMVHRGSDLTVKLVGALSIGFAVGLLVGGANRVLVLAALVPAALVGATLVERLEDPGSAGAARRV